MNEHAMAFMWNIGSGVSRRSRPGRTGHKPPWPTYHSPITWKYRFDSRQPLGVPVVPEV